MFLAILKLTVTSKMSFTEKVTFLSMNFFDWIWMKPYHLNYVFHSSHVCRRHEIRLNLHIYILLANFAKARRRRRRVTFWRSQTSPTSFDVCFRSQEKLKKNRDFFLYFPSKLPLLKKSYFFLLLLSSFFVFGTRLT